MEINLVKILMIRRYSSVFFSDNKTENKSENMIKLLRLLSEIELSASSIQL